MSTVEEIKNITDELDLKIKANMQAFQAKIDKIESDNIVQREALNKIAQSLADISKTTEKISTSQETIEERLTSMGKEVTLATTRAEAAIRRSKEMKDEFEARIYELEKNIENDVNSDDTSSKQSKINEKRGSKKTYTDDSIFNMFDTKVFDDSIVSEEKVEEERRKSNIFGRPSKAPNISKNDYGPQAIITAVTRESFPSIELRNFNLEYICIFMDEYEAIQKRYPRNGLNMVDFIARRIHPKLIITASDQGYLTDETFGSGLYNLDDNQLKDCIQEIVKAESTDDFIRKIKSVSFPQQDNDKARLTPSALNFPILFDRAMHFVHKFMKILKLISTNADYKFIPPLYKEGKTLGLVDYFLDAWPGQSGIALYKSISTSVSSLGRKSNFAEFAKVFFDEIKKFRDVKGSFEDLEYILTQKHSKRFTDDFNEQENFKAIFLTPNKNRHYKDDKRNKNYNHHHHMYEEYDQFDEEFEEINPIITPQFPLNDDDPDPEENLEQDEDEEDIIAAVGHSDNNKPSSYGCWYMLKYGTCTKVGCKARHDKEAMTQLIDQKLRDICSSNFVDPDQIMIQKVTKYLKEKPNKDKAQFPPKRV